MSQQIVPVNGGVQQIQTTTANQSGLLVFSSQYVQANSLGGQPTQWIPGGRPIYRRLPGTSETYQVDFFNIAPAKNTAVAAQYEEIGYVFIPWGIPEASANTLLVSSSDSKQDLLIKSGVIVWKYGNTEVPPTIVNLPVLDTVAGKYELAYQLIYDDSPVQKLYQVEDFALTGQPLAITSSTDSVIGWRYAALNAFLNTDTLFWSNFDSYFPPYSQPTTSYIQWESDMSCAYSGIELRCPPGTAYSGTATLNYFDGTTYTPVETVSIQSDSTSQLFQFDLDPRFQTGWQVVFSSIDVSIQSVVVSGIITMLEKQAAPSSRAALAMYPLGTLPSTVTNSSGKEIPAVYCSLAIVDIGASYNIEKIEDTRYIIRRDYQPVADWLTRPFDDNLINLYEQVSDYSALWLAPPTCLKQEYIALEQYQINVEV